MQRARPLYALIRGVYALSRGGHLVRQAQVVPGFGLGAPAFPHANVVPRQSDAGNPEAEMNNQGPG
jgi:hypothetical protein